MREPVLQIVSSVLAAGVEGFALSIGLILALGPQNVFVLRQGLLRSHVFAVCLVCSIADATLIAAGVLGMGSVLAGMEGVEFYIAIFAATFISGYGILRVRSAMNPSAISSDELMEQKSKRNLGTTLGAALAFTFLNPHVYVDTLLLIGGASSRFLGDERIAFGIGAATASFVFFFSLGYGAKRLSNVLNKPQAWKMIDLGIACIMFIIATAILLPHLQ